MALATQGRRPDAARASVATPARTTRRVNPRLSPGRSGARLAERTLSGGRFYIAEDKPIKSRSRTSVLCCLNWPSCRRCAPARLRRLQCRTGGRHSGRSRQDLPKGCSPRSTRNGDKGQHLKTTGDHRRRLCRRLSPVPRQRLGPSLRPARCERPGPASAGGGGYRRNVVFRQSVVFAGPAADPGAIEAIITTPAKTT